MKIIFMGTPQFSVEFLQALQQKHEVVMVVTQPDRPAGRGRVLTPPPVKMAAEELGLPVLQPESLKDSLLADTLAELQADISVVVAFSILPRKLLEITRLGALNLHGSLLPAYRGAAPVQWAVAQGEQESGVTCFRLDEKMDHGPVLVQEKITIPPDMKASELFDQMVPVGVQAVLDALEKLETGSDDALPQNHAQATPAPKLTKEDGLWSAERTVANSYNRFRGFYPWPGTWMKIEGMAPSGKQVILRIHDCAPGSNSAPSVSAGSWKVSQQGDSLLLGCADGVLAVRELQIEGKKRLSAADFLRGVNPAEQWRVVSE